MPPFYPLLLLNNRKALNGQMAAFDPRIPAACSGAMIRQIHSPLRREHALCLSHGAKNDREPALAFVVQTNRDTWKPQPAHC